MNRWEVVTQEDDDEVWGIAEQVVQRELLENGQIRWVIDTDSSDESIREGVPSVVSVVKVEPGRPE